jgi:DNA-binding transcriptional regulator YhcF (GntR family)
MADKVFIQIEGELVEAKDDSLKYVKAWKSDLEKAAAEHLAREQAKEASKKSAIEKLTALGLTEQEVYDLLGVTPVKSETE